MTSSEVIVSSIGTPTGTCSSLISCGPSVCCSFHIHCLPTTKISCDASGGRELRKYKLEDQKKSTAQMAVGTTVHVISSAAEVSIAGGISLSKRRRYRIMK